MEKTFLLHLSAHWGDLIEQIKKICHIHFNTDNSWRTWKIWAELFKMRKPWCICWYNLYFTHKRVCSQEIINYVCSLFHFRPYVVYPQELFLSNFLSVRMNDYFSFLWVQELYNTAVQIGDTMNRETNTVKYWFFEPLKETKIGLKNRIIWNKMTLLYSWRFPSTARPFIG